MHTVVYTRGARRGLRRISQDRVAQIIGSLDELAASEDPARHPNVKGMKGDWEGFYRLRIGSYRAIFGLNPAPDAEPQDKLFLISVEAVGTRQNIY